MMKIALNFFVAMNFLFENETQNNHFFIIGMYVVVVFDRGKEYVVSFELYLCCLILLKTIISVETAFISRHRCGKQK